MNHALQSPVASSIKFALVWISPGSTRFIDSISLVTLTPSGRVDMVRLLKDITAGEFDGHSTFFGPNGGHAAVVSVLTQSLAQGLPAEVRDRSRPENSTLESNVEEAGEIHAEPTPPTDTSTPLPSTRSNIRCPRRVLERRRCHLPYSSLRRTS